MLTAEQKTEMRALIEQTIAELEESIPRLQERIGSPVEPDVAIGRLSRLDSMQNAGTARMALEQGRSRLTRLRNRLRRLDDADFDQCAMCGAPIPWERLAAAPDRGVCSPCLTASAAKKRA